MCVLSTSLEVLILALPIRHGESVWNKANFFTGWTDVGLTEKVHGPTHTIHMRLLTHGL